MPDSTFPRAADPDQLLTTREAAKLISYSESALNHWRCKGVGPRYISFTKRSIRYRRSDLVEWVKSQVVDPVGEGA